MVLGSKLIKVPTNSNVNHRGMNTLHLRLPLIYLHKRPYEFDLFEHTYTQEYFIFIFENPLFSRNFTMCANELFQMNLLQLISLMNPYY